jgi:Na+/proline symporter
MKVHPLDFAVIAAYLFAVFIIGLICYRRVKNQKDLFLGGRRFGKFMMAFQSFGIGTHSEQVVAVVGQCYALGLAGIWWQFMWLFATPIYWLSHPLLRRMRMVTSADYWAERFSPGLGTLAAVLGVFQVVFTMATLLKAMCAVLNGVAPGAIPETVIIPITAALFVFYGAAGGLYAATITDVIQGLLIIVLSLLLLPYIFARTGGMAGLHQILDPTKFSYTIPGEMSVFFITMLSLNALIGCYTMPTTMTNLGSGRNEWDVRVGVMAGTLMKRFCTVAWAFLGIGALALAPALGNGEHAFGWLIQNLLPHGLIGLMIAAILAGVMSICSALMLSGSALITRNLYTICRPHRSENHYLSVGRLASAAVVVVAMLIAFCLPDVLSGLKGLWAVGALMGLAWWAGIVWPRTTAAAAWISSIVACAAYAATLLYNDINDRLPSLAGRPDLNYAWQIAIYLGTGLAALILTSYLTTHPDPAKVHRFYRKMRTPTTQKSEFDAED